MDFQLSLIPGPLLLVLSMLGAFAATATIVLVLTTPYETPAMRLVRYSRYTGRAGSPGANTDASSMRDRLVMPLLQRLVEFAARAAPSRARRTIAADLIMAGSRMNPTMFLGIRTLLMFGLPGLAVLYVIGSGGLDTSDGLVLALALIWGRRLPTMWLKRRIKSRQRAIDRNLPYSLDLMVACLEGGLSLDATLAKVVEQTDGPLAAEIRKTLQEMALGRPTAEAIRDLGDRTGAPGLKRLTEDIVQSDRMGISIAESLRGLAREARVTRRQHAEELARKAPIKMVPVLIFCVLPALGIITTAPAAILLMRTFSQSTGGTGLP
ncbi:MAG TPA: type II secretion system F family protein [Chloroflexota bacterium]|jgi:tight adherence protein C|nr:type II secretion system F family protein [Chloroflexota bacterium]